MLQRRDLLNELPTAIAIAHSEQLKTDLPTHVDKSEKLRLNRDPQEQLKCGDAFTTDLINKACQLDNIEFKIIARKFVELSR